MSKFNKVNISCSFLSRCANYSIKCSECKWNSANNFGNHLVLKDSDGRTIKYLEKNLDGN